ncbi:hypothetical protein AVEN_267289-1 [Araneus ventricosus]|uniref:Uncharacterized protein n=1 Tax=Araneus ventricosus TaxID=182803 RepID=A0A4Y2DL14_ARAVE|nr:hypothetical protein AVEN_267289-1 [Araneus ventricosus]
MVPTVTLARGILNWQFLYHPLYFLDFSPCDYDLVPNAILKSLGRNHFMAFATFPKILKVMDFSIRIIGRTSTASDIQRVPHRWETSYTQLW